MAGTRFPSNTAPPDAALGASNRRAASYYATSAQSLYSDLWQDMRTYIDAYCSVTRNQPSVAARTSSSSITDFSGSSPSNQSGLSYQQPYPFPRDLEGTVNFAQLESSGGGGGGGGGNAHPMSLDKNDSSTVAPTIQFDLGSNNNLLSCSSQQGNLNNFSSPYDYSSEAPMSTTQANTNQTCFPNDPTASLTSSLWKMGNNFSCPSPGRNNLSGSNVANGPTVDFTARWGMRNNNLNGSPVHQQSSVSNNNNNVRGEPCKKRKSVSEAPAEGYVNISDYSGDHQAEDMTLESLYPGMSLPKYVPEWRRC